MNNYNHKKMSISLSDQSVNTFIEDRIKYMAECKNCETYGFPCLNCAQHDLDFKYGHGNGFQPNIYLLENMDDKNKKVVFLNAEETFVFLREHPRYEVIILKYENNQGYKN